MMFKKSLIAAFIISSLLVGLSSAAQAHEVWIERDGNGPVRIYLGEPETALPEGGDPEFAKLQAPKLLPAPTAQQVRKAGYIEAAVPAGDVRAWDDSVFSPWGPEGKRESVVYYARAGRSDASAVMPLEIVPAAKNADRFVLVRDGQPVVGQAITVISPDKWTKSIITDAQGVIAVPSREKGRYLLTVSIKDEGSHATPGGQVDILHRIATTTFVAG